MPDLSKCSMQKHLLCWKCEYFDHSGVLWKCLEKIKNGKKNEIDMTDILSKQKKECDDFKIKEWMVNMQ